MCIIIAKEKIGRLPTENELKNSFEWNNDGAGFMYTENGKVIVDKGYMTWQSFIGHYKKLLKKFNNFENKSLVIHCRIGTSGKNNKGNTHPYPITNNPRLLHTRKLRLDLGMAHNGIISGYGTPTGLNDTQEFIIKYLYPLYTTYKDFYKNEQIRQALEKITSSKLAFLDNEDNIYYVGDFIHEDNGLNFSNSTYEGYSAYYSNYHYSGSCYNWNNSVKAEEVDLDDYKDYDDYDKESYLMPLEKNWHVDLYGNGHPEIVGERRFYYDWETLYLYESIGNESKLVSMNPLIYDEAGKEIDYFY